MKKLLLLIALGLASIGSASFAGTDKIEFNKTNFVNLNGEVDNESVDKVLTSIYKSDPKKEFYIAIDSPGGSVFAGLRLVRFLQSTDRKITCVTQTAISMAFIILQACPTRVVLDSAVLMSHGIAANLGYINVKGAENSLRILKGLENMINKFISERLKVSVEDYIAKLNPEYWLIGGTVILKDNAADSIGSIKCTLEVEGLTEETTVNGPFGPIKITRPLCPF